MAPPGWEIVAPGGPRGTDDVRSWFVHKPQGFEPESVRTSLSRLSDLVADLRGDAGRPVVVAGHSQGAALAMLAGTIEDRPDGIVAVSGFWPELSDGAPVVDGSDGPGGSAPAGPPALVVARSDDGTVPAFLSLDAAEVLRRCGSSVDVVEQPGGHALDDASADVVRNWLIRFTATSRRVSLALPVDRPGPPAEFCGAPAIADLAATWERLGFAAAYVTDHPAPDDRWVAAGGHHALEPTVALSAAAVATSRLLLHTFVYVLGYRNPFLAAKALSSLDVLSGGRLLLGVAAGYLRTEFEALDVPFADRGERLSACLRQVRAIMAGEEQHVGERTVTPLPRPVQRPHPPIWVGGNSRAARRRAIEFAEVWAPFPTPSGLDAVTDTAPITSLTDLGSAIADLTELSDAAGRPKPPEVAFVPFALPAYLNDPDAGLSALAEEVEALYGLGVSWVVLSPAGWVRTEVIERATDLAETLGLRSAVARA